MQILLFIFVILLYALIYLTLYFFYREHKLELRIIGTRDVEKAHIDSFPTGSLRKRLNCVNKEQLR